MVPPMPYTAPAVRGFLLRTMLVSVYNWAYIFAKYARYKLAIRGYVFFEILRLGF